MKEAGMAANPRMLQRRVSNNRLDLDNDQQMNYLLSWFNWWSDLQKEDFVPILGNLMNPKHVNGITEDMKAMKFGNSKLGPSLFDCQIGLFKNWFLSWSDDKKNYLVQRLQAIDSDYFKKYETYLVHGMGSPEKDYFEPGIPPELDLSIDRSSTTSDVNDLIEGPDDYAKGNDLVEGHDDLIDQDVKLRGNNLVESHDDPATQDDKFVEYHDGDSDNKELCKQKEVLSSIAEEI